MQPCHGSLESIILNALWDLEKNGIFTNSVRDVYDILSKNKSEQRAYTTLKTVMDRLVGKKLLMKFKQGRKFFYRTAYSNDEVILNFLKIITDRYCGGDFNRLIEIVNNTYKKNFITA